MSRGTSSGRALRRWMSETAFTPCVGFWKMRAPTLAGCLLLLYGQPFTRTAALRRTDITGVGGQAGIRLGRGTLPLPPPMDTIARLVLESQPSHGDGWLFAGRHPGTHLTAEHLRVRVACYGLARITQSRAAEWARTAGQDYGSYVGLRPELAQVQSAAVATVSTTGAR
jgi:hypothetical protein